MPNRNKGIEMEIRFNLEYSQKHFMFYFECISFFLFGFKKCNKMRVIYIERILKVFEKNMSEEQHLAKNLAENQLNYRKYELTCCIVNGIVLEICKIFTHILIYIGRRRRIVTVHLVAVGQFKSIRMVCI